MRLLRKYIICAAGLLATLAGCQDEEIYKSRDRVKEGIPTNVRINFKVDANELMTRAIQKDEKEEFRLENMYVMIFDGAGNRIKTTDDNGNDRSFFERGEAGGAFNPTDEGTGYVSFKAITANDARIVGVVNLKTATCATDYPITKVTLDAINSLDELKSRVMTIENSEPIERGVRFMMTGYAEDENGNNKITIKGDEGGTSSVEYPIKLRRVDAKIEVKVTAEAGDTRWKHFSFKPGQWRVMRAPSQSLLLPAESANTEGNWDADGTYVDTQAREFEELTRIDVENEHLYAGGNFAFYLPENRKQYKKKIEDPAAYYLRDKQLKENLGGEGSQKPGQIVENGAFEYANDNSTYLLMTGHLSYTDENGQEVNADTRYIVHLGYAKKTGSAESADVNDYNTLRNGHYTYNIKVKGVNDIEVEVEDKNEKRPGHEGDIVYSSNKIFTLDSHYDRELLEIKKTDITDKMTWSVKTPFSSGICTAGISESEIPTALKDYKWIKFAINKLYGQVEGKFVKYPGDQNYDDPDIEGDGVESPFFITHEGGKYKDARLMDIHQLITYLKANKENAALYDGDHICITAFIDENLYFINPQTGESNLELWKSSVEKEDRQLHIITEEAQYSEDGNSSIVHSLYTFTQKAIRTVYNVNKTELKTAWGLESVMETERLEPGDVSQGTDSKNGRKNTLKWLENKSWTQIINTSVQYGLNSGYNTAAYACLLRNRDLNGDNVIQSNEIRWYLAAIDQLTDIYLGEYALDEASRLYPQNATDRPGGNSVYWHYTSSSANGSDPWILWAEEGASRGSYASSKEEGKNGTKYAYRCIRNLGILLENVDSNPTDLIQFDGSTNTFDLTNMNPKALRTAPIANELTPHNERDALNRPFSKFEVYPEDRPTPSYSRRLGTDGYYLSFNNDHNWRYYQTTVSDVPQGYRIPNQRELLIMASRMLKDKWKTYRIEQGGGLFPPPSVESKASYICKTAFSLNGQGPYKVDQDADYWTLENGWKDGVYDREGFLWHAESGQFSLQNRKQEEGYIRAVRDITE